MGVLLRSPQQLPLGTLCAIDYAPREIGGNIVACLQDFAEIVKYELYRRAADTAWLNLTSQVSSADLPSMAMNAGDFRSAANQLLLINNGGFVANFICDVPKLQNINRTFGGAVGSELLLEIARRIRLTISKRRFLLGRDLPHRFVGLVDLSGPNDTLEKLADELSSTIGNRVQTSTNVISTPINIGLTLFAPADDSIDDSIRRAQLAIDDIPVTSSGVVTSVFRSELHDRMIRCYGIAAILEPALNDKNIQVFFQPKISVRNSQIIGAEALMRWTDDQLGPISPLEILEAAQKIDFMPLLDEGILKSVCSQLTAWMRRGLNVFPISINLSGTTFMLPNFVERVTSILSEYQLPFHLIDREGNSSCNCDYRAGINYLVDATTSYEFELALPDTSSSTRLEESKLKGWWGSCTASALRWWSRP
ncbi:GGDEF-domain containing protein [Halomicronema hongdechloris C2206]|uniref:GGDEF-domain containing protein n=1 Tax=Halomicronema hongdechloris C2206 TaxID=1641165 RepID=A0A1Z3HUG2_9CYAN|nr:GGDEF-domain containing protein [Halomicronema hongdechloris C2206]